MKREAAFAKDKEDIILAKGPQISVKNEMQLVSSS